MTWLPPIAQTIWILLHLSLLFPCLSQQYKSTAAGVNTRSIFLAIANVRNKTIQWQPNWHHCPTFIPPQAATTQKHMDDLLFKACVTGQTPTFLHLFTENNRILQQTTVGSLDTPLHLASRFGHPQLALQILNLVSQAQAMALMENQKGETPLHEACRMGHLDIVRGLLETEPCAVYKLNRNMESALFLACLHEQLEVAHELSSKMDLRYLDEIGSSTSLHMAASKGYTGIVRRILEANPSLETRRDGNGFSPLHLALIQGKVETAREFLIRKNSDLCFLRDNNGRTPLHWAVISTQVLVAEILSESPDSAFSNKVLLTDLINLSDNNGDTVLHLAAKIKCLEIIELLLKKHGIHVNATNKDGLRALDILQQATTMGVNVSMERNGSTAPDITPEGPSPTDPDVRKVIELLVARTSFPSNRSSMGHNQLSDLQHALMVVAVLIASVTFQAGLNPPGGLWQDSRHNPGKAIQSESATPYFTLFMVFDAVGFLVSLTLILTVMSLRREMLMYVNRMMVVAILSMEIAFVLGLFMISERKSIHLVDIIVTALAPFTCIGWIWFEFKPRLMRCFKHLGR